VKHDALGGVATAPGAGATAASAAVTAAPKSDAGGARDAPKGPGGAAK
jgi:hypothetical protein